MCLSFVVSGILFGTIQLYNICTIFSTHNNFPLIRSGLRCKGAKWICVHLGIFNSHPGVATAKYATSMSRRGTFVYKDYELYNIDTLLFIILYYMCLVNEWMCLVPRWDISPHSNRSTSLCRRSSAAGGTDGTVQETSLPGAGLRPLAGWVRHWNGDPRKSENSFSLFVPV